MGNTCPSPGKNNNSDNEEKISQFNNNYNNGGQLYHPNYNSNKGNGVVRGGGGRGVGGGGGDINIQRLHQMDELMIQAQQHSLKMMREDIKTDLNGFILDNLILCIQLFDNFDKVSTQAKEFKHEIEKQVSEKLTPVVNDGAIHGERRCFLIHGMGHELAQNYIYKDKVGKIIMHNDNDDDSDVSSSSSEDEPVDEEKRTFNCEGILPLEFIVTWDNLEVYKENEWDVVKDYEYSAAKGMASIARFCLEEPNEDNKIPKGYARLRCVDVPMSIQLGHDPIIGDVDVPTPDDVYYSRASDFTEKIYEVPSDSDIHSDDNIDSNRISHSQSKFNKWGSNNNPYPKKLGGSSQLQPGTSKRKPMSLAKTSEWANDHSPLPIKSGILSKSEPNLPEVIITPDDIENQPFPHSSRNQPPLPVPLKSNLKKQSAFPAVVIHKRFSKSVPKLTSKGAPKENLVGEHSGARSRSSSIASEEIRKKWRKIEIKNLSQFPNLTREHKSSEPIHQSCFTPFKVEIDSDDENWNTSSSSDSDDDDDDDESEDEDEVSIYSAGDNDQNNTNRKIKIARTKSNKKKKKKGQNNDDSDDDSKFELRYYLNSSAVSSEFCSEFNKIGQQIGIPSNILSEAMVLGTTIRCSIPYPKGLGLKENFEQISKQKSSGGNDHHKGSYKILYTFTPSLHSKSWPQRLTAKLNWAERLRNKKGPEILMWPQLHQAETLELSGCNIIPLGFRSLHLTQSDYVIQPFNWQIGFAHSENALLNTFKNVHWRCYIISSLLFHAFLGPLGPLGLGLEHIRNIMYGMCNTNFYYWPEETPGKQLNHLLKQLYENLSESQMSNFFVNDFNMLKNIPSQNTKKIQATLKPIKDNTIIHCIYIFRNLKIIKSNFYPLPNFQQLYKILIAKESSDLIEIGIDNFGPSIKSNETKGTRKKKTKKKTKKGNGLNSHFLQEGEDVGTTQKMDRTQQKAIAKRKKYDEKIKKQQREEKKKERDLKTLNAIPQERRSSIDLTKVPEKKITTLNLRLPLLLKFFIPHFIQMAKKSLEFLSYSQTAMYILHIENLCQILDEQLNETYLSNQYREEIKLVRDEMGIENMREYVKSKYPHLDENNEIIDEVSMLNLTTTSSTNNWVLESTTRNRELPPLPIQHATPPKKIQNSKMIQSLKSIPTLIENPNDNDTNNNIGHEFEFEPLVMRPIPRAKSIKPLTPKRYKFVQKPYFSEKPNFIHGAFITRDPTRSGPTSPPILYTKNLPQVTSYLPNDNNNNNRL